MGFWICVFAVSQYTIRVFFSLQSNQQKFSISGKGIAKHCHFSFTEVTLIRKIHSFLIVHENGKVVYEVSFWYNANYSSYGVFATPA